LLLESTYIIFKLKTSARHRTCSVRVGTNTTSLHTGIGRSVTLKKLKRW